MKQLKITAIGLMIVLGFYLTASADYKDDIGYTKLETELGGSLPDGSGVPVTQAEAQNADGFWMPDDTNADFSGKTLNYHSGAASGEYSGHATSVGRYFFGNTLSMAPGITTVDSYSADYWLGSDFLNTTSTFSKPSVIASRVANHSWIGDAGAANTNSDILRRLDWVIETDEFIQAVGLSNGSTNSPLLSSALNAIAVGCSDGEYGIGSASVDDTMDDVYLPERTRQDIVAPQGTTSAATPVIASACALLIGVGHDNTGLSGEFFI